MMDTPVKTVGFMVLYLLSLRFIRDHMANKKPYELKHFLIFYNFIQVCGSFYIFVEVYFWIENWGVYFFKTFKILYIIIFKKNAIKLATVAYLSNYSLVCQPVDYSTDPLAMRVSLKAFIFSNISKYQRFI